VSVVRLDGSHVAGPSLKVPCGETVGGLLASVGASRERLIYEERLLPRSKRLVEDCGVPDGSTLLLLTLAPHVRLDIGNNERLSLHGITALAEGLPEDSALESVRLPSARLWGAESGRAVAAVVNRTSKLQHLDLSGNGGLCASGVKAFAQALNTTTVDLKSLDLDMCELEGVEGGEAVAAALRAIPGLLLLRMVNNRLIGAGGVRALTRGLPENAALQSIFLGEIMLYRECGGEAVAALLAKAKRLESLSLFGNRALYAAGVQALATDLTGEELLTSIDLGDCGLEGGQGGKAVEAVLQKLKHVKHLEVSSNWELQASGLMAIAEGLGQDHHLESMTAARCGLCGALAGDALGTLMLNAPDLKRLQLPENRLCNDGLVNWEQVLSTTKRVMALTSLSLGECDIKGAVGGESVAMLLRCCPSLEYLDLSGNEELGNNGLVALKEGLQGFELKLEQLRLGTCNLEGREGGAAVADLLSVLPTVRRCEVSGNRDLGADGIIALTEGFIAQRNANPENIRGLDALDLGQCGLDGPEGGLAVAKLIRAVPLEEIRLASNWGLSTPGIEKLSKELLAAADDGWNCKLKLLDISECWIAKEAGGFAIARLIRAAPDLETLNISFNWELSAVGFRTIAASLPDPTGISSLQLEKCGLAGPDGGRAVAEVAACCPCLEKLNLANNWGLSAAGVVALVQNMPSCPLLAAAELGNCELEGNFGGAAAAALASVCLAHGTGAQG